MTKTLHYNGTKFLLQSFSTYFKPVNRFHSILWMCSGVIASCTASLQKKWNGYTTGGGSAKTNLQLHLRHASPVTQRHIQAPPPHPPSLFELSPFSLLSLLGVIVQNLVLRQQLTLIRVSDYTLCWVLEFEGICRGSHELPSRLMFKSFMASGRAIHCWRAKMWPS